MAYADLLNLKLCSLGWATQTSTTDVPGGSYTYVTAHDLSITPEAPVVSPAGTVGRRGAAQQNRTGRVWHRLSFKTYAHGQLSDYDYTSDTPALDGVWGLCTGPWTGVDTAYHATGVNASDGNTVSLTNNPSLGALIAFANSSAVVGGMGFVKSKSGAGPYTANLFEDLPAQPGSNNKHIPTKTLYPGTGKQAFGFQILGEPTAQDFRLYGGYLTKREIRFDEADNMVIAWEFMCFGGFLERGGAGGLQAISEYLTMDPLIGAGNGRIVLGSNVFTAFNDGTVDSEGHCDVRDIVITDEFELRPIMLGSLSPAGVKDVSVQAHTSRVSFSIPSVTDYDVSSANAFQKAFTDETKISFSLYMGDTPGKLFAHQLPAGQVVSFPGYPEIDGVLGRSVELIATHWQGDGASTDAGNRPSRWGIG